MVTSESSNNLSPARVNTCQILHLALAARRVFAAATEATTVTKEERQSGGREGGDAGACCD